MLFTEHFRAADETQLFYLPQACACALANRLSPTPWCTRSTELTRMTASHGTSGLEYPCWNSARGHSSYLPGEHTAVVHPGHWLCFLTAPNPGHTHFGSVHPAAHQYTTAGVYCEATYRSLTSSSPELTQWL